MPTVLFDLIVQPIVIIIEVTFSLAYRLFDDPGWAIVAVSLVVNVVSAPLYQMADARQEEERERQKSMEHWVTHIKQHFSGDEQYMILNTYYRQRGYKQWYAFGSSVSLLLQIPIFMAAYTYLSGLSLLDGAPFLMIQNLGQPDALLAFGTTTINVLPVLMTVLNIVSSVIYTKGLPLKDKAQPLLLAALFLVLLYGSPSGLVFYWTCNQVFSLARNVVTKVLKPSKRTVILCVQAALAIGVGAILGMGLIESTAKKAALLVFAILAELLLWKRPQTKSEPEASSVRIFLASGILLSVLLGLLVPSALVGSSPVEFVGLNPALSPLHYVGHVLCVMAGFFLLWGGVFYWLSSPKGRQLMAQLWFGLCCICLADYFITVKPLGVISTSLVYDNKVSFTLKQKLLGLLIVVAAVAVCILAWKYAKSAVLPLVSILIVATAGMSAANVVTIVDARNSVLAQSDSGNASRSDGELFDSSGNPIPIVSLSGTQKNVVVLFLDRGLNCYVPYMLNESSELRKQFDGFTYYPNTLSFGEYTVFGSPAVYGGYDYTLTEMNARDTELLVDKHREALLLMPRLFSEAGYTTTMINGPVIDYSFSEASFPAIETVDNATYYHTVGEYNSIIDSDITRDSQARLWRNFVYYSFFSVSPSFAKKFLYNGGKYLEPKKEGASSGLPIETIDNYSALAMLPNITTLKEDSTGSLLLLDTELPHEQAILQLPDYTLSSDVDNTGLEDMSRFTLNGETLRMDSDTRLGHYHVNMASFKILGAWFDELRELGVYDNTRIIIVADHGRGLKQLDSLKVEGLLDGDDYDAEWVNPVFMVKDFDSHGFTTSNEFMTNADTPSLALKGIVDNPINPDTGNPVTMDRKYAGDQIVSTSRNWRVQYQNGTVFDTSDGVWLSVHDNIFDDENWTYLGTELPETE